MTTATPQGGPTETYLGAAKPALDTYTPKLLDLRHKIHSRIHTTSFLLTKMTTPIKDKAQEPMREENIERIRNMTLEIRSSLLNLETCYRNDLNISELKDFRSSLGNIES